MRNNKSPTMRLKRHVARKLRKAEKRKMKTPKMLKRKAIQRRLTHKGRGGSAGRNSH